MTKPKATKDRGLWLSSQKVANRMGSKGKDMYAFKIA
jgi:hypothetical protein